jgi:hypothetical protein
LNGINIVIKGPLSDEERNCLISQHKKERGNRTFDRVKAVLLYDKSWTLMQI